MVERYTDNVKVVGPIPTTRTGMNIQVEKYVEADRDAVLQGLIDLQNVEVAISNTRISPTKDGAEHYLESLLHNVAEHNGAFLCAHTDESLAGFVVLLD